MKNLIPQPKIQSLRILNNHAVLLSRQLFFAIPKQDKLTGTTPFYPVGTMELLTPWRRSLNCRLNTPLTEVQNIETVPPFINKALRHGCDLSMGKSLPLQIEVFRDAMQCQLVNIYRRFEKSVALHIQTSSSPRRFLDCLTNSLLTRPNLQED